MMFYKILPAILVLFSLPAMAEETVEIRERTINSLRDFRQGDSIRLPENFHFEQSAYGGVSVTLGSLLPFAAPTCILSPDNREGEISLTLSSEESRNWQWEQGDGNRVQVFTNARLGRRLFLNCTNGSVRALRKTRGFELHAAPERVRRVRVNYQADEQGNPAAQESESAAGAVHAI